MQLKIFGRTLSFGKQEKLIGNVVSSSGGWFPIIREPWSGAWQHGVVIDKTTLPSFYATFSCVTLIASDVAKLRPRIVTWRHPGYWSETRGHALDLLLARPNHFQSRIQFVESWVLSKLLHGNTYALKRRGSRGEVDALYILDPSRVRPMVADDGSVFYEINPDNLAGTKQAITVPAREIIHDRMNTLFHPLVGISPLYAAGLAATQGLKIQENSASFFGNLSRPGGILTAPGAISDDTAARLKSQWEDAYAGNKMGRIAVLGDSLKFEPLSMSPEAAQLIEQLKHTAESVCNSFRVPPFKVGVGQMPTYQNAEILNHIYYSDCLQSLIEQFESAMDEGLGLGANVGIDLCLDDLLRMDRATQVKTLGEGVQRGIYAPNEARMALNLPPVDGGDSPFLQEQNWPIAHLTARDVPTRQPTEPVRGTGQGSQQRMVGMDIVGFVDEMVKKGISDARLDFARLSRVSSNLLAEAKRTVEDAQARTSAELIERIEDLANEAKRAASDAEQRVGQIELGNLGK